MREVEEHRRDDLDADEQDDESQIERDLSQTQRRNDLAQQLQRRIGERVHDLGEDEEEAGGPPVAGEHLDQVEHDSCQEHVDIEAQSSTEDVEDDGHVGPPRLSLLLEY
mgnify:CR=1 FL=1